MHIHPTTPPIEPSRRLPLFLIGGLLFVIGPALNAVQVWQAYLSFTPWYLPVLSTLGVVCMIASVWQRGGIARGIGLAVFTLFCGLQWLFFVVIMRTPDYDGPATVGKQVPAFVAARADGSPFSNHDLQAGPQTVLLFFRGRW